MALTNLASPVNYNISQPDIAGPIAGIGAAYAQGQQRKEQQSTKQAMIAEAQELFRAGDIDAIGEFAIANPELGKTMFEIGGIRDEAAAKRMVEMSKAVVMSQSPVSDLKSLIEQGELAGRDMTHSKKMLESSGGDPEQLKKIAEMGWASSEPKSFKSYRSTLPKDAEPMTAYQSSMVDSKKIDQDLRREESMIKREENKLRRETDVLKKEELQNSINARKEKVTLSKKSKIEQAEDDIAKIGETTSTIDRMLAHPGLASATGWQANFPTLSGTAASGFEAMMDTLQSQAFLSQVSQMKGMGALSENEGKKLAQAIGALSIDMGDDELRAELGRIKETLELAQVKAKNRMPKKESSSMTDEELLSKYGG